MLVRGKNNRAFRRRIIHRIAYQIDQNLHDQAGIHARKQQFSFGIDTNRMSISMPLAMAHRLLHHVGDNLSLNI